jgi:hypothetical protein
VSNIQSQTTLQNWKINQQTITTCWQQGASWWITDLAP